MFVKGLISPEIGRQGIDIALRVCAAVPGYSGLADEAGHDGYTSGRLWRYGSVAISTTASNSQPVLVAMS